MLHAFTWSVPLGYSSIDLSESHAGTTKVNPLLALAEPRFILVCVCVSERA